VVNPAKTLLLLGIVSTLGWGAFELQRNNVPEEISAAAPPSARVIQIDLPQPSESLLEDYESIVERPLFYADRKLPRELPRQESGVAQAPILSTPPELRLTAIVIEDDQAVALAEDPSGTARRLRKGEDVSGWEIKNIEEQTLILTNNGREHQIPLRKFDEVSPPRAVASPTRRFDRRNRSRFEERAEEVPPEPRRLRRSIRAPIIDD